MFRCTAMLFPVLICFPTQGAEMRVHRDLGYTEPKDERRTLDLYAPGEAKDRPVVIWIHGGGWRRGDKAAVQHKPKALTEKGFVFVSVNYRFVPQVTVKEMTGDIAKAIRWAYDHAEQYGGSPEMIFVAGHSAGAHLAALACTDDGYLKAEGLPLATIKGCIPIDTAVYDVVKQVKGRGPLLSSIYAAAFGNDEAGQKEISPITHVAEDKGIPPFLILHVAARPDARTQSQAFAKALRKAGVEATVVAGEGKTHATINRELGLPDDTPTKALFEFLEEAVRKARRASGAEDP